MAQFKSLSDCPVCRADRTKKNSGKKCREWESGFISCWVRRDGHHGESSNGYRFKGTDRAGSGTWIPAAKWDKSKRAQTTYAAGSLSSKLPAPAQTAKAKSFELPGVKKSEEPKVDENLRAWAWANGLEDAWRAKTQARGVSAEAIRQATTEGLLFSIEKGDNPDRRALPGKWDDNGYAGPSGMAIVGRQYRKAPGGGIASVHLGAQVATGWSGAKYLWLSKDGNAKLRRHDENPITVHAVEGSDASHATITEGFLKPWVALQRADIHGIDLGRFVLGVAGSHWASTSWKQIKSQCKLFGVRELRLAIDGGAVMNRNVLNGVKALAKKCDAAGISFRVIWYGQMAKKDALGNGTDIDEIGPVEYELLAWDEFALRCPALTIPSIELPGTRKSGATATPGFERDYGYLPHSSDELFSAFSDYKLIALVSDCGTGKTQLIKGYLDWAHAQEDSPYTLAVTHRNALGESQGEMYGLPVTQELEMYGSFEGSVLTADSGHMKSKAHFTGNVPAHCRTIFDEADQVADHMVAAQTAIKHVRTECLENISKAGHRSKQVLLMSAGLSDLHIETYARTMGIPMAQVLVVVNTHKRDMGRVYRCAEAAEVFFRMDEAMQNGERFIAKLSGQQDTSLYSTQTISRWAQQRYPHLKGLVLDSETCNDPSNPNTYIEVKAGEISIAVDADGGVETKDRVESVRILSYLNHPDSDVRRDRQAEIFGKYDYVLYTNACSTGISFEQGGFDCFFQIENGAGSIDDCMQSTARYRPTNIKRFVFCKEIVPAPYGNGATDHALLAAGKNNRWEAYIRSLVNADVFYLPDDTLLVGGNVGRLWQGYAMRMEAKRNGEARAYAEGFFNLLRAANYTVDIAFIPGWAAMDPIEKKEFKAELKACRDQSADINNKETSVVPIDNVDLPTLEAKHQRTRTEGQQITKAKACERYGIDADAVTPELIKEEKNGLYLKLLSRLYLSLGAKQAAKRDAAKAQQGAKRGRTWADDILRTAQSHKVAMQEDLGVPALLAHLSKPDAVITEVSPQVVSIIEKMKAQADDVKSVLNITVGKKIVIFGKGDAPDTHDIEVSKPITLIKSLLKTMHLDVKSQGRVTIDGRQVHKYGLVDKLIIEKDGVKTPIIDYEKFAIIRQDADEALIEKAKNDLNAEAESQSDLQPEKTTDKKTTDPYNRDIDASVDFESDRITPQIEPVYQGAPEHTMKLDPGDVKDIADLIEMVTTDEEFTELRAIMRAQSPELWTAAFRSLSHETQAYLVNLQATGKVLVPA